MAEQDGSLLVLKIGDGGSPETFDTVGGLRTNSFQIGEEPVDVSSKDDTDKWERAARFGAKSASFSGSGIFKDDAAFEAVRAYVFDSSGALKNFQGFVPDYGTFEGQFIVTQFSIAGDDKGAVTFDMTLQSAGPVAFATV